MWELAWLLFMASVALLTAAIIVSLHARRMIRRHKELIIWFCQERQNVEDMLKELEKTWEKRRFRISRVGG